MKHITIKALGLAILLVLPAGSAQAVSLFLSPASQTVGVGDPATVEIRVSGLASPGSLSLGAWAADFTYDDSIVQLDSITFGTDLDTGTFGSIQTDLGSGAGLVSLDEVSFEDPADLDAAQPSAFVLATIDFTALAPGVSPLAFVHDAFVPSLSDELGFTIDDVDVIDAEIRVRDGGHGVPDGGSTVLLLGLVAVSLVGAKRKLA